MASLWEGEDRTLRLRITTCAPLFPGFPSDAGSERPAAGPSQGFLGSPPPPPPLLAPVPTGEELHVVAFYRARVLPRVAPSPTPVPAFQGCKP